MEHGAGALPLRGYRVVDVSQMWAGPQMAATLGDLGAEVIRIESRAGTDAGRLMFGDKSDYWKLLESQRYYRSRDYYVAINIATPEGLDLFRETIRTADVFVTNLAPRALRKLHITYEELRPLRPDLVMAAMSAAGRDGPWSDLMGYGPSVNAVIGGDSLVGYPESRDPMSSFWDADPAMATAASFAVFSALYHRQQTGVGQLADLSFCELLAGFLGEPLLECQMTGRVPGPKGNRHVWMAPHGIYPSKGEDSWVSIAVASEEEWRGLCQAIGRPALLRDRRFRTRSARLRNREALDAIVSAWTTQRTSHEAMEQLQDTGVAAASAFHVGELYHDPHDTYRRTSLAVYPSDIRQEDVTHGISWRLSDTPGALRRLAQPIGTDNRRFLEGLLGLSAERIAALTSAKVLS